MEQFTGFWQILIITILSFWTSFAIGACIYVIWSSFQTPADEKCQTTDAVDEETEIEATRQLPNNEVVYYEERNERSREMIYV